MDFTLATYKLLLHSLQQQGFSFQRFNQFLANPASKVVVLRHDVDRLPTNSLKTAQIENESGIKGSYYFRIDPESFDENVICKIASLGHEIGYHYETMNTCKGDVDKAYDEFCRNLETFRRIVPVSTVCMLKRLLFYKQSAVKQTSRINPASAGHGSPRSPYDNRDIWKKYNYRDLGILGEPYLDLDFKKIAYYTDTGRMWDGQKYSVRDKILISHSSPSPPSSNLPNCITAQPAFSANADKSGRLHNCKTAKL